MNHYRQFKRRQARREFRRIALPLALAVASALWLSFLFVGAAVNASQAIAGAHAVASR